MTQEEKELLLADLCARLPYGVKIKRSNCPINLSVTGILGEYVHHIPYYVGGNIEIKTTKIDEIKPYLRPMSSMTEEEKEELRQEHIKDEKLFAECLTKAANGDSSIRGKVVPHFAADWCNKNHFDYRVLIPMGLALEAPKDMYVFKN